jgi:hypothetical protein
MHNILRLDILEERHGMTVVCIEGEALFDWRSNIEGADVS